MALLIGSRDAGIRKEQQQYQIFSNPQILKANLISLYGRGRSLIIQTLHQKVKWFSVKPPAKNEC